MSKFTKNSLLSPKPYTKYLNTTVTRGYSPPVPLALMFSTPAGLGGVNPSPPDLFYVAEGYVENGYV